MARQYYEKLKKKGDESPTIYANLAYFYKFSLLTAIEEEKEGNAERAKVIVFGGVSGTKSSKSDYPSKKRDLHRMVKTLYEKAIERQERAVKRAYRARIDPEWLLYIGINLGFDENYKELKFQGIPGRQRLERMREYYHLALKENANYHKAINNLAWLYSKEGKVFNSPLLAVELGEKAAEITEWNDFEHQVHTLAEALRGLGETERAIAIVQYAFHRNSRSKEYMEKPFEIDSKMTTPRKYLEELRSHREASKKCV